MTLDEFKQEIEQQIGVPSSLLSGESEEECIAQAKALLIYRSEYDAQRPKNHAEQFKAWFNEQYGIEEQDEAGRKLAEIEEQARVEAGGYPRVIDGGEVTRLPDPRPNAEKFAEWLYQQPDWGQKSFL